MERTISDEEKIRRAIEISQRRNNRGYKETNSISTRVNVNEKKNYKLFRKMIIQITICLLIYMIFYLITTTNYAFSADIIKNTNNILNYDINFSEIYNRLMKVLSKYIDGNQGLQESNILNNTLQINEQILQNNITNNTTVIQEKNLISTEATEEDTKENSEKEDKKDEEVAKTQAELDVEAAQKICKFQKPLSGRITSEFGEREATIKGMTTDHKGIDIAANSGTSIKSAISGKVSVAEENSEYGKFIKIVNGDVMTVYAHCKALKVKVGDKIEMGQTIATVGSTGNSTGPHLHFEIRYQNRYINPRLLIKF